MARAQGHGSDKTALPVFARRNNCDGFHSPHDGQGSAAVGIGRSALGDAPILAERAESYRSHPCCLLTSSRQGWASSHQQGLGRQEGRFNGSIEANRLSKLEFTPPKGCSRIDVLGGPPIVGLQASLWDKNDEKVAWAEGGEQAALFACTDKPTGLTLELQAVGAAGPYLVEIRKWNKDMRVLYDNPIGAARLLGRLDALDTARGLGSIQTVQELTLDADKRASFDVLVPPGQCRSAVVASGVGATGLTLAASDSTNRNELGRSSGSIAASVSVCASEGERKARITADVRAGHSRGFGPS